MIKPDQMAGDRCQNVFNTIRVSQREKVQLNIITFIHDLFLLTLRRIDYWTIGHHGDIKIILNATSGKFKEKFVRSTYIIYEKLYFFFKKLYLLIVRC